MFNRNLFLLVRNICTAGSKRIEPINPNCLTTRYFSKKSLPPPPPSTSCSDKNTKNTCETCEPCEEESDPDYGCETPTSHYPNFPLCDVDGKPRSPPKDSCPPPGCPICEPPKEKPPCESVCPEEPKKPVECPPKSSKVNLMRMISLLVVLPAIIGLSVYVFMTREEIDRPPFVPYPFMRKQNFAGRKWPWNSEKSLFYNSRVNALYDGYEEPDEEEIEEEEEEAMEEVQEIPDVEIKVDEDNTNKEE